MSAEAAVVIPVMTLVALVLAWFVTLGVVQVRVVDAARETARSLARGDAPQQAVGFGRRVAPDGARFRFSEGGGTVTVRVTAPVRSPLGFLSFLPHREVQASAVALSEAGG